MSSGESDQNRKRRMSQAEEREMLFQKRLAELRAKTNEMPWHLKEESGLEIPAEQSKLFADRDRKSVV